MQSRLTLLISLLVFISCQPNSVKNKQTNKSEAEQMEIANERIGYNVGYGKKFKKFAGIRPMEDMAPTDITDKYFRIVKTPHDIRTFEIIEISNLGITNATLNKRTIEFDYDCNAVTQTKKLSKDCFKVLSDTNKEITKTAIDSLFALLEKTEFWNLRKEHYSDDIIYGGSVVEIDALKAKSFDLVHSNGAYYDTIATYQNSIFRQVPEQFIGVSMIEEYVDGL